MNDEHRELLRKKRDKFLKDLDAKRAASKLYSRGIFSEEDKDEVNAKKTNYQQREEVMDILPRKGPKAFLVFCDILHEISEHLEAELRPVQEEEKGTEKTDGSLNKEPLAAARTPTGESNIQNHSVEDDLDVDGLFKFGSYNLNKAAKQLNTATMYKMTSTPRGIAVIISNKNFLESSGQHFSSREGTEVDREALKRLFKILQFKVEIYNNQTKAGIRRVAVEMAAFDHSKYDAFIFAVLSHGREGVVYGTDGIISIRDITSSFTQCRSLAGKPKIFFFQACQEGGDESDAKLFEYFGGGGGVPAKPTGDAVDIETIYKMSRAPRGIAIIINNKNFLRSSGMDRYPRNGTDVDRDALEKLFKSLKFEVRIYNDITKYDIRRIAKEMATFNHSAYDAFIFSILTHGEEGLLYGTDGTISTRDLTSAFKDATTLAGKPKMFFFQACQGHEYMDGMDVPDGPQASSKVSVPAEADFLYAYSTVPGYYSWRNSVNGSWFIQSLTEVFEENAERMDILRMLTRVNARVSTFKSRTGEYYSDSKRQVSSIVSMLRKELYFFPEKVTGQN
ncbi:uncharacterized protein LOC141875832 [Acropora palmata]|uniref:uncharacterized protein LOC141875832 n=1 Tax=Acropora palmata TaxID=6131 RepID=UPI003DA00A95